MAALVLCGIATCAVSLFALLVVGGGVVWLSSERAEAIDRLMAVLLVVIGLLFLATPAVLMWVALAWLVAEPPRGALLMIACLRALGGFVLLVALPTLSRAGGVAVIGVGVGVALAFLAVAQVLAAATRPRA
jgi:hypothetical protein